MPELKFATIEKFVNLLTNNNLFSPDKPKRDREVVIAEKVERLQKEASLTEKQIAEQTELLEQEKAKQKADPAIQTLKADLEIAKEKHKSNKTDENRAARQLLSDRLSEVEKPITDIQNSLKQLQKDLQKNQRSLGILEEGLTKTEPSKVSTKPPIQEKAAASTQSSGPELEITKRTKLTPEEALLLLQNIHLLRAEGIPNFNKDCAKELRLLLFREFSEICGSDQVRTPVLPKNFQQLQTIDDCDDKMRSAVIAIRSMGMHLDDDTDIKKLRAWFNNDSFQMLAYLKAANYSSPEAFERSFSFELPNTELLTPEEQNFWYKVNVSWGRVGCELFSDANRFSTLGGFKDFIKSYLSSDTLTQDQSNEVMATLKKMKLGLSYGKLSQDLNNPKILKDPQDIELAKKLAEVFSPHRISEPLFDGVFDFIKARGEKGLKKSGSPQIPDLNFEFEVVSNTTSKPKKYKFQKLEPDDYRGFILGKLTNCCQSFGDHSSECVEDGMTKDSAGFYVVTDDRGKIVAQSYAWLAEGDKLVFDSFESLGRDRNLFVAVATRCSQELTNLKLNDPEAPSSLMIGTGGGTPKIAGVAIVKSPKPVEELYMYGDAREVYTIDQKMLELAAEAPRVINSMNHANQSDLYYRYWFGDGYNNPNFDIDLFNQSKLKDDPEWRVKILDKMIKSASSASLDRVLYDIKRVLEPLTTEQVISILSNNNLDIFSHIFSDDSKGFGNEKIAGAMIERLTDKDKEALLGNMVQNLSILPKSSKYHDRYSPQQLSCRFLFGQLKLENAIEIVRSACSNKNDEMLARLIEIGCDKEVIIKALEPLTTEQITNILSGNQDLLASVLSDGFRWDDNEEIARALTLRLTDVEKEVVFRSATLNFVALKKSDSPIIRHSPQQLSCRFLFGQLKLENTIEIVRSAYSNKNNEALIHIIEIGCDSRVINEYANVSDIVSQVKIMQGRYSRKVTAIDVAIEKNNPEVLRAMLSKLTPEQAFKALSRGSSGYSMPINAAIVNPDLRSPEMFKIMLDALTPELAFQIVSKKETGAYGLINGQSSVDLGGPEFLKVIFQKLTPQAIS